MSSPYTNPAIKKLLRTLIAEVLKDLESSIEQINITVTMQEISIPIASRIKGMLEVALKILDDEDVNISSLGVDGTDLREQSENIRAKVIKLFDGNTAPVMKYK